MIEYHGGKCRTAEICVNMNKISNNRYAEEKALLELEKILIDEGYTTEGFGDATGIYNIFVNVEDYTDFYYNVRPIYKKFKRAHHIR